MKLSKTKRIYILNLLAILSASPGVSEPRSTAGLPALPCSKVIEWKDDDVMKRGVRDWLYGFWSGWNFAFSLENKAEMDLGDPSVERDALTARVLAFCYEKPQALLMEIAIDFYFKLPELPTGSEN